MSNKTIILLIHLLALTLIMMGCSTGPVRSCQEDPDQIRCEPREWRRGDRHTSLRLRWIVCRGNDEIAKTLVKCRKQTMLAVL